MSADSTATIRDEVTRQALAGQRLDAASSRSWPAMTDILSLGALADDVRRRRHGGAATFVRVHVLDVRRPGGVDGRAASRAGSAH